MREGRPKVTLHLRLGAFALLIGMVTAGFWFMGPLEEVVFGTTATDAERWKALALMAAVGAVTVIAPFKAYDAIVAMIEDRMGKGERE